MASLELYDLDKKHIGFFINAHRNELNPSSGIGYTNVRCPFCQDKSSSRKVKKGYFVDHSSALHIYYKCMRDSCVANRAMPYRKFLNEAKDMFYQDYIDYNNELLFNDGRVPNDDEVDLSKFFKKESIDESEHYRSFTLLTRESPLQELAISYCKSRLIPEDIWSKWYVAIDGKYKGRLIIPIIDSKKKIRYFQGRDLLNRDKNYKYLNKVGKKYVFNLDFVDPSKTVFVFEGIIDSLHCENAVAVLGLGDEHQLKAVQDKCSDICYVMDDDEVGRLKANELLLEGKQVFLWQKFKEDLKLGKSDKWDLNTIVVKSIGKEYVFPHDQMMKYIARSFYDKFWL